MRVVLSTLVILGLVATAAYGQTGVPTSWTLRIYQAGTLVGAPVTVTTAQVQCNQPPPAATSNVNPRLWFWNDVANAGRVCLYDDGPRFAALADGTYDGTATATNADGTSAETAPVPFVRRRPNPPAVPTGLGVTP